MVEVLASSNCTPLNSHCAFMGAQVQVVHVSVHECTHSKVGRTGV